jgi:hypothetical protein
MRITLAPKERLLQDAPGCPLTHDTEGDGGSQRAQVGLQGSSTQ